MILQDVAGLLNIQFSYCLYVGIGNHRIMSNSNVYDTDLPILKLVH